MVGRWVGGVEDSPSADFLFHVASMLQLPSSPPSQGAPPSFHSPHTLNSTSSYAGAEAVQPLAAALELAFKSAASEEQITPLLAQLTAQLTPLMAQLEQEFQAELTPRPVS